MAELATAQHGVVAYRQLIALGFRRGAIQRRVRAGRLHPLHRGVYAVGHRRLSRHGHWLAAVLACGPTALLSHRSAAALWDLRPSAATRLDVTAAGRTRHNRRGIAIHRPRRLHPEDRARREGVPVTSIARTLLDLAQVLSLDRVERALDEAERRELLDLRATERLMARCTGHRGMRKLKAALRDHRAPAPTRSALERRFLDLCRASGLPRPQVNVLVAGVEVDAAWPGQALVAEIDGHAYHRTRKAFEDDRRRDMALQLAGYRVVRVTHRRLEDDPAELARMLRKTALDARARAPRAAGGRRRLHRARGGGLID